MTTWLQHVNDWKDCQRCPLAQQRGLICLARGTIPCEVIFIGEAPGASEDTLGQPFVGPAGMRLDAIIARALPATATYAMTNLVACFPRNAKMEGFNEPERGEVLECRPRLVEFVNLAQPRLIVCVGRLSTCYAHLDNKVPFIDIVHPAAILRMPLAQQQMATQKCVVQIRNAYEDAIATPYKPWVQWGEQHASVKTNRAELRSIYDDALRSIYDAAIGGDIPF